MPVRPTNARGFFLEGAKELDLVLKKLPNAVRGRVMRSAAMAGARVVRDTAKRTVPVEQGDLRDAIVARSERDAGRHEVKVKVGPTRRGFYGLFLEFGTVRLPARPWLRPAWEASKGKALNRIGKALGPAIERAAKKLAGPLGGAGLGPRSRSRTRRR